MFRLLGRLSHLALGDCAPLSSPNPCIFHGFQPFHPPESALERTRNEPANR